MKNTSITIEEVKKQIKELQGKNINMEVNKGRNKIVKLLASVDKVYPSMFVIKPQGEVDIDKTSYSYSEVLCGNIKFKSF